MRTPIWVDILIGAAVAMFLVLLALVILAVQALSRDLDGTHAGSPLGDWYKRQANQMGQVCCDDADGHEVADWGRTKTGYWVEYDGTRHDVPDWALVSGAHPQGKAVVWIYPRDPATLRCFLPSSEG
jgi:hypothetical protein